MIEVRKNEKESSSALIRRFTRKIQQSSVLRRARSLKFRSRPESKLKKKMEALKRVKAQKRLEYKKKMGKI